MPAEEQEFLTVRSIDFTANGTDVSVILNVDTDKVIAELSDSSHGWSEPMPLSGMEVSHEFYHEAELYHFLNSLKVDDGVLSYTTAGSDNQISDVITDLRISDGITVNGQIIAGVSTEGFVRKLAEKCASFIDQNEVIASELTKEKLLAAFKENLDEHGIKLDRPGTNVEVSTAKSGSIVDRFIGGFRNENRSESAADAVDVAFKKLNCLYDQYGRDNVIAASKQRLTSSKKIIIGELLNEIVKELKVGVKQEASLNKTMRHHHLESFVERLDEAERAVSASFEYNTTTRPKGSVGSTAADDKQVNARDEAEKARNIAVEEHKRNFNGRTISADS